MEKVEKQFEDFIEDCKRQRFTTAELSFICQPLLRQQRWQQLKCIITLIGLTGATYLLLNTCEQFAWLLSAIGRLMLMQLLPFWNWTPLYNTKCLIERDGIVATSQKSTIMPALGRFETDADNCLLCENLAHIPTATNTTFSSLEATYLERGIPAIVTDSHTPQGLSTILDLMQLEAASDFLRSEPCDLATNLMLKKFFNFEIAFQKILQGNTYDGWFLQLRNCQFDAVKSSRLFVTRPYFYPVHLEPFYTSWLLMSHNLALDARRLYLQGLIIVQQLSGCFHMQLQPKQPCNETCPIINLQLQAGESLVFSTDLWIFKYGTDSFKTDTATAIATILEIDWHL